MSVKALVYSRISTDDTKQNIERQFFELKQWADSQKIEIVETFEDRISGGVKGEDRPQFKAMLEFIKLHEIKLVLISELSRLGRDTVDVLTNIRFFASKGVNIFIKNTNNYTINALTGELDPSIELMNTMVSAFAQNEKSILKERINSGLINTVNKGVVLGKTPFGYDKDETTKQLIINEKEADVVKFLFASYIKNKSFHKVTRQLNDKGYRTKTGAKWSAKTVKDTLKRSIYTGVYEYKGQSIKVPKIVNVQDFDTVKNLVNNISQIGKGLKYVNPLKGIAICVKCGKALLPVYSKYWESRYICLTTDKMNRTKTKGSCCAVSASYINNIIIDIALNAHSPENYLRGQLHEVREQIREAEIKINSLNEKVLNAKKWYKKQNIKFDNDIINIDQLKADKLKYTTDLNQIDIDKQFYTSKIQALRQRVEVFNNPKQASKTIYQSPEAFADFCQQNIISVEVESFEKGGQMQIDFHKVMNSRGNKARVFKMHVKANLFEATVFFAQYRLVYVHEWQDVKLKKEGLPTINFTQSHPFDLDRVKLYEKRLVIVHN